MPSPIKFIKPSSEFSKTLKNKVNAYFSDLSIRKEGNMSLMLKGFLLILALLVNYIILVFFTPVSYIAIPLCILLGLNLAAIGFNIMHDAGHDTFSSNKSLNNVLSYSLNLLGGNIYLWKLKHNISHHTFTNINGSDHDIEIKFMRVTEDQPLKGIHRYQTFYFLFLYSISYLAWIFYQDYEKYFSKKLSKESKVFILPRKEKVIFWVSKVIHSIIFLVIPIYFVGFQNAMIGILIASLVCGLALATVFQLAHVVHGTEFKNDSDNKIDEEWMVHQLQSTSNFATKSRILTWLLGGLNFQVEHHLFPKISHIHYPRLNSIIRETCKDYGVSYHEHRTFFGAFRSHYSVIHAMSK